MVNYKPRETRNVAFSFLQVGERQERELSPRLQGRASRFPLNRRIAALCREALAPHEFMERLMALMPERPNIKPESGPASERYEAAQARLDERERLRKQK